MSTTFQCRVYDRAPLNTKRQKTPEGYLLVPATIAASDNVQPYLARELGITGAPPDKVIRVYRPKAVMDAAAPTFEGKPITLEHPSRMVDAKIWKAVARGDAHNVRVTDTGLDADLLVRDDQAILAIERKDREELSAAYDFKLTMQSGVSPHGQAYDAVASDVIGNHIAIVRMGRSRTPDGRPCRVADSNKGDRKMRVLVFDAALLGLAAPMTLPELDDGVASTVDGLVRNIAQARDSAVQERDAVLTECASRLEVQATDHAKQLKEFEDSLPARIEAAAQDRALVLAGAAKLGIELKAEGKDTATLRWEVLTEAIKEPSRKAVMDAMIPDLAKATPEALSLATAALFALPTGKQQPAKGHDSLGRALAGQKDKKQPVKAADADEPEKPCGREAAMQASASAWRTNKDKK